MNTRNKQAQRLIAQQLPDLHKLIQLLTFAEHIRDGKAEKALLKPNASASELDEYHSELKSKLDELLSTAYATELYLLILPTLIEIKQTDE